MYFEGLTDSDRDFEEVGRILEVGRVFGRDRRLEDVVRIGGVSNRDSREADCFCNV